MANRLKQYFPQLKERQQVLDDIMSKENLKTLYENWKEDAREYFLDICTGVRGVKMLYDSFFKEIFDPDAKPERLEELLSLLLTQQVKILKVLPNDSTRIADESSLLIMDIVVQLEDGSIANVECQKIGYAFQGQRAACYPEFREMYDDVYNLCLNTEKVMNMFSKELEQLRRQG